MKYLKSDPESVIKTAEALRAKKIVIIPTDTVYGFSGIVSCSGDVHSCVDETDAEIRRIKGREAYKPFIQLISSPEDINLITDDPLPDELFSLWPGALTIIVNDKRDNTAVDAADGSDESVVASAGDFAAKPKKTVAVRCPGDAWLREVIRETGAPIYSTSVNRSGKPVLTDIADIIEEFGKEVELIIDDGDKRNAVPSTIVSLVDGKCKVIRQGSVVVPQSLCK
ncbi:MAG: L-threonylcarbamoyladenylate synthase [Treponemataceae bacterium]|nr:L-threonylcarbamoyladenylate synthase [Treponemataceae bacterium]